MKKLLTFLAAASVMFLAASCKKDDNSTPVGPVEKHMTLEEQAKYLNSAGIAILDQVQALDFQPIATAIADGKHIDSTYILNKDDVDTTAFYKILRNYIKSSKVDNYYYVADLSKFAMNAIFKLKSDKKHMELKFEAPAGVEGVNVSCSDNSIFPSNTNYSANLNILSSNQLLRVANYDSLEAWTKTVADTDDIFVKAPTAIDLTVSVNGTPYTGISLRPDFSEFPADPWYYILKFKENYEPDTTENKSNLEAYAQLLPLLNLTAGADFYVNGANSYRIHVEKVSINGTLMNAEVTIYGKNGSALLTGGLKLNALNLVPLILNFMPGNVYKPIELTLLTNYKTILEAILALDLNVLDNGVRLVWSENETLDIYMDNSSNPQMWVDPDDIVANVKVTKKGAISFADVLTAKIIHTADTQNALVSMTDVAKYAPAFNELVEKANKLVEDFEKMFGGDDTVSVNSAD